MWLKEQFYQFSHFLCPSLECELNKGVGCRITANLQPSLLIVAKFAHFSWELKFFYNYLIVRIQCICKSRVRKFQFRPDFEENKIYEICKNSDQDAVYEITELANIYFREHSYMTSDVFRAFMTYLPTYLHQILYYISLFSKIRWGLTYLPTQKSDVIYECSLMQLLRSEWRQRA